MKEKKHTHNSMNKKEEMEGAEKNIKQTQMGAQNAANQAYTLSYDTHSRHHFMMHSKVIDKFIGHQ